MAKKKKEIESIKIEVKIRILRCACTHFIAGFSGREFI